MSTADARYSHGAIAFHWTIALLVVVNLFIGLLHESLLDGVAGAIPLHKSIGLTVLVLTVGRIAWRLAHRPPPLPAAVPGIEKAAAQLVHWSLYALLLLMPLTGWAMSSDPARSYPLTWFGLFAVPKLPVDGGAAGLGHDGHALLGWVMLALVALHIAAALRHHFVLRDRVLARMLPGA